MRKQYHLWPASTGFDAWDVGRLIGLSRGLPVRAVAVDSVREVDTIYWFDASTAAPTSAGTLYYYGEGFVQHPGDPLHWLRETNPAESIKAPASSVPVFSRG